MPPNQFTNKEKRKEMNVLELFAGSRSIGKVADERGFKTLSIDKFITENMDLVMGVESVTKVLIENHLGTPDIIWASPVCSAWSKTGWFHYWDTDIYRITKHFLPKHTFAMESVEMVRKSIEIFSWFPNAVFFMENPDGLLQFHPVIRYFQVFKMKARKHLITYCQYGDTVRKPTNIWTNCDTWNPKPICSNGDKCHIRSPRCTQTGILAKKDSYERSVIPEPLCIEVIDAALSQLNKTQTITPYSQQQLFRA